MRAQERKEGRLWWTEGIGSGGVTGAGQKKSRPAEYDVSNETSSQLLICWESQVVQVSKN